MRNLIDFRQSAADIFQLLSRGGGHGCRADEPCVAIACGCVCIYMFEPERQHVRMLVHIFPGVPTGTSAKSMLLAKPRPPAPGGNAAIDYMLMQLCRHTWPPADPQHAPEKLQLPEQTQLQFSTHQYRDRDRCVSCRISEGIWEQFSPGAGCFPWRTEWMGSL